MTYIKPNLTFEWIKNNGFRRYYKDGEDTCYSKIFPVYKDSGGFVSLVCKLSLWFPSGKVTCSVEDATSKGIYASYYNREYGNAEPIINRIDKAIQREFKNLGIVEVKNDQQHI